MTGKLKRYLEGEEGSGLILALMTLMVLSVLGASLGAVTIGSHRLSGVNRDTTSAYYVAEAGVNQAFEELKTVVLSAYADSSTQDSFFDKIDGSPAANKYIKGATIDGFGDQFGDSPESKVHLVSENGENDNIKSYTLKSEGTVDNKSRVVEKQFDVTWVDKNTGLDISQFSSRTSIISQEEIDFIGGNITGDLYIDSLKAESFKIGTWGEINSEFIYHNDSVEVNSIYKMPDWRNNTTFSNNLKKITYPYSENIPWGTYKSIVDQDFMSAGAGVNILDDLTHQGGGAPKQIKITDDAKINNLTITGNRTIVINNEGNDINLFVNNLTLNSGHIEIVGGGVVNLYIQKSINYHWGSLNKNGDYKSLNIYYESPDNFRINNDFEVRGSLFFKVKEFEVTSSFNLTGFLVTNTTKINVGGNALLNSFVLAPYADLRLTGKGIYGQVIANSVYINSSELKYSFFDLNDFPFESNGESSDLIMSDIIGSQPIVEPQ